MNYYKDFPQHMSNTDWGNIGDILNNTPEETPKQYAAKHKIFDFGNLIDYMITEPQNVNCLTRSIELNTGETRRFTKEEFYKAEKMRDAFFNNGLCFSIYKQSIGQKEFYRTLQIEHDGFKFKQKVKCKFDLFNLNAPTSADIKTTAAANEKQFYAAFGYFKYERQGAFYMDIGRRETMVYLGISKNFKKGETPKIFTHVITKGDKDYLKGKQSYSYLAFQYQTLFTDLNAA